MEATEDEIAEIDGVGKVMADNIKEYFSLPQTEELIQKFREAGVNLIHEKKTTGSALSGSTFVVTGTLSRFTRNEVKELIEQNGGKVSGSISKKTSFLLAGEAGGSKLKKAADLGVPVIGEDELLEMISHG